MTTGKISQNVHKLETATTDTLPDTAYGSLTVELLHFFIFCWKRISTPQLRHGIRKNQDDVKPPTLWIATAQMSVPPLFDLRTSRKTCFNTCFGNRHTFNLYPEVRSTPDRYNGGVRPPFLSWALFSTSVQKHDRTCPEWRLPAVALRRLWDATGAIAPYLMRCCFEFQFGFYGRVRFLQQLRLQVQCSALLARLVESLECWYRGLVGPSFFCVILWSKVSKRSNLLLFQGTGYNFCRGDSRVWILLFQIKLLIS